MEKKCGIYKIINIKNKKVYIGESLNINGRWKRHKSDWKEEKIVSE